MDDEELALHRTTLLALTRLMSQWSSLDYQQRIAARSGVRLDPAAVRAVYALGIAPGPVRPSAIADELYLTRPATSKLIARLDEAGLIERSPAADDGRSVLITLTAQGGEAFAALFSAGLELLGAATAGWDRDEVRALSALLTRFTDGLLPGPDSTGPPVGPDPAGPPAGPDPTDQPVGPRAD